MDFTPEQMLRLEALDKAVRISLAHGGDDSDETVVKRSEKFYDFLMNRTPQEKSGGDVHIHNH